MTEPTPQTNWQRSDALFLAGLIAAPVAAFLPLLLDQQSFFRPSLFGNDWQGAYVPMCALFRDIVRSGCFPLWTTSYLAGTPLLGLGQSGLLYPFTYFYALAPFHLAYAAVLIGQLILIGIFTFLALRDLNCSSAAAFLAALWMMLAGPVLWASFEPTNIQGVPWFVLLCLAVLRLRRQPRWLPWLIFVLALSLEILSGDPEVTIYACLFVALVVAALVLVERLPLRRAGVLVLVLAAGVILAGLITLPQSLTAVEFFSHCIRTTPFDYEAYRNTWPTGMDLLGLGFLILRRQTGEFFFGLLPLALLALGLLAKVKPSRRPIRNLVLAFLALGLVLALNRPLHLTPILYHLPILSLLNRHFKLLPFFQFFACLGIALGLEAALAKPRRLGLGLAIIGLGLLDSLFPDRPLASRLALAAAYLLALLAVWRPARPGLFAATLILISLTDILAKVWDTPYRLDYPRFAPSFHQFFASADRDSRTVVLYPLTERMRESIPPVPLQAGVWEGTSAMDEWFHVPNTRYLQFLSRLDPRVLDFRQGMLVNHFIDAAFKHQDFVTSANRHLVDYLSLRYFATYHVPLRIAEQPQGNFARRVHDQIDIYENLQALPRAFLVHGVKHYPREDQLLTDLAFADRFQPRAEVFLSGPGPDQAPEPARPGESVAVLDDQQQTTQYQVRLTAPGYFSTSDNYLPGWRAWVDEKEVPVLRGNYTFRALALGPGDHRVIFRYAPLSFEIGLWGGLASLLLWLGWAVWYSRRGHGRN